MNRRMKQRLLILAASTTLALLCGPAPAFNGNVRMIACACQTTSDFTNAATTSAQTWDAGTYVAVSTSTAMTSYVQVAGHLKINGENAVFVVTSATPVDSNSNSLTALPD